MVDGGIMQTQFSVFKLGRYTIALLMLFIVVTTPLEAQEITWITHESETSSISLPASWRRVDDPQIIEQITSASLEANSQYTQTLGFFQLNTLEFYMVESDLNATLTLMPLVFENNTSLIDIATTMTTFYSDLGIEVMNTDFASLPAGMALRLQVTLPINQIDGDIQNTTQLQYIIYAPNGQSYILTASLPTETFDANLDLLETIIATLTVNNTSPLWFGYSSPELLIQAPPDWEIRAPDSSQNEQFALGVQDSLVAMSLRVTPIDILPDLDTLIIQLSTDYEAQGGTVITVDNITLPIGDAIRIQGTTTQLTSTNESITIGQYMYVVLADSLITVTFTSEETRFDDVAPVFTRIMATARSINQ